MPLRRKCRLPTLRTVAAPVPSAPAKHALYRGGREHPAHGALHRAGAGSVQGLLALIATVDQPTGPGSPPGLFGGRRPTDAPVSLDQARGQAGGAASLAPSCQPEPRYSRCGYPCAPMWLRMQSRLRWREQYQTGLPLCDAHHSWTSLQGQERQRQADVLVPANRGRRR